jgi:nitrile hydratase subunit alpha
MDMKQESNPLPHRDEALHDHNHSELSPIELRVRALESILVEKGYVDPAAVDTIIEAYALKIGPRNGAKVVARAWADPSFKRRLLEDATVAVAEEFSFGGRQGEHLIVVENIPSRHNLVVCTLCSCYPWPLLGLPPVWYKSAPYRSRAVMDPRGVLAEFGVHLPPTTEIRVYDSTAEMRYMVLPMQPDGTQAFDEVRLAELVTRESMIGTGIARDPAAVPS